MKFIKNQPDECDQIFYLTGDVCWTAAVLSSLGGTLRVMLDADQTATVVVSAAVAVAYTLAGGMHAVAVTDVAQLGLTLGGLWLAVPYVLASEGTSVGDTAVSDWTGTVGKTGAVNYVDTFLLILCGMLILYVCNMNFTQVKHGFLLLRWHSLAALLPARALPPEP